MGLGPILACSPDGQTSVPGPAFGEPTVISDAKVMEPRYAEVQRGAMTGDRQLADAALAAATASLSVMERRFEKLQLTLPVNGVVEVVTDDR